MVSTIRRKIFRDIMSRRFRTFLVSASIFVGVLGVIALFTTRDLITSALSDDLKEDELTMIDLVLSVDSDATLDNDGYLSILNGETDENVPALEGVERAEGWAYNFISFREPGEEDSFEDAELRAYSENLQDLQLEPMRLDSGEWPSSGQVVLEVRMAERFGFEMGDTITFRVPGTDGLEDVDYEVSGLVFHPYSFRGLTGDIPGPDVGIYAQFEDAQALLGFNGYTRFVMRYETFEQAEAQVETLPSLISEISPYVVTIPIIEDPAENTQVQNADIFNNVLSVLALVTMLVSGFLVINVINTIVAEQKQQIGILKAIGASDGQNFIIYSGICFIYGVLGTTFAILPGIAVGNVITNYLAPTLDILIEDFDWSPGAVLIGVVMGLTVPVLAAAIPVFNGIRVTIMDAITDLGIGSSYGLGRATKFIGNLPLPITLRQALSNVYQKRSRLALTGITLILTVAAFMATLAVTISLDRAIRGIFDRLGYEILVETPQLRDQDDITSFMENTEGVSLVSPAALVWIQMGGDYVNFFTGSDQVQVFGIDPADEALEFELLEGTGWDGNLEREGAVISFSVANQLGVSVGDDLSYTVNGRPETLEIIGIDEGAFDAINIRWETIARQAGLVDGIPRANEYFVLASLPDAAGGAVPSVGLDQTLLSFLGDYDPDNPSVFMSGSLAERADLEAADTVDIQINGKVVQRPISAVIPDATLAASAQQANISADVLPPEVMLFSFNDLVEITEVDLSNAGDPIPNAYYVTVDPDLATIDETDDVIETLKSNLLAAGITANFENQLAAADAFTQQVVTNTSIFAAAAVLIALVGAIGLLTTLTIAVFERQKEIGVMRSIGAGSTVISIQFILEGVFVGVLAWLIGIPVSYVLALMFNAVVQLENVRFVYPVEVLVIGLVGIVTISALASLGPSLAAARKTVSEILRYQ